MEKFLINGGNKLYGEIDIPSAKNSLLPLIAGSILVNDIVTIKNFIPYDDVLKMLNIMRTLGSVVSIEGDTLQLDNRNLNGNTIQLELAKDLRASIFTLGAIVARAKFAKVAYPGGCAIGARPIDLHLSGLSALGVRVIDRHGYIYCYGDEMHSTDYHLDFASVGATENTMMASCTIEGTTKIFNPAKEPEIVDLQNFLNCCGANIEGAGTDIITIKGTGKLLHSCEYTPIGDRIIAGTMAIAVACTGGKVKMNNVDCTHIFALLYNLQQIGCEIKYTGRILTVSSKGKRFRSIEHISTMPYPAFPTDLQPQIMVLLAVGDGTSVVTENLFENRFKHIPELTKMGAKIHIQDRNAIITGVPNLYGAEVTATDLRAGACLVIAGLIATGYTTINDIYHIDRGYYRLEDMLGKLGADIERKNE